MLFCWHGAWRPQETWGPPVLEPCKPRARDISIVGRRKKRRKGKMIWLSSHTQAGDRAEGGLYPELVAELLPACLLLAVPVLRETCLWHLFLQRFLCSSWNWDFLPETASPACILILSCSSEHHAHSCLQATSSLALLPVVLCSSPQHCSDRALALLKAAWKSYLSLTPVHAKPHKSAQATFRDKVFLWIYFFLETAGQTVPSLESSEAL